MFILLITYKKSLEIVDNYLADHANFLEQGYQKNYFIVSGRKNPRTGGVILSQIKERSHLAEIISHDPFYIHDVADYEIIEFIPGKYHPDFVAFIE